MSDEKYENELEVYLKEFESNPAVKDRLREAYEHLIEFGQVVYDPETLLSAKTYEELLRKTKDGI